MVGGYRLGDKGGSLMAGIELGVPYYVYNPSQAAYFALNSPTDPKFCGYVTDVTGLDDAGVRENAQVVVAGDGGYHGPFWRDRRPWTISGIVMPIFPLISRDASQELMEGIFGQAMQSDGFLTWTPADGVQRMLKFRKQQPFRIATGQAKAEKTFQMAAVTADFRVISWARHVISVSGGGVPLNLTGAVNLGNATASPVIIVTGPAAGTVRIVNTINNKQITMVPGYNIGAGVVLTIDIMNSAYPSVVDTAVGNQYGAIDPLNTDWSIGVEPTTSGTNIFALYATGTSAATSLQVQWRDSWL